jgi:hypothetical protein
VCAPDQLFADERKLLNAHRIGDTAEHLILYRPSIFPEISTCERAAILMALPSGRANQACRMICSDILYLAGAQDRMEGAGTPIRGADSPFFEDGMFPPAFAHPNAGLLHK